MLILLQQKKWYEQPERLAQGYTPDLALDFLNQRYAVAQSARAFTPLHTVTRTGNTATTIDQAGNVVDVAADTARFNHVLSTGAKRGLHVEAISATNQIPNNTMQGIVAGDIGSGGALPTEWESFIGAGLTLNVVGSGTEKGMEYAEFRLYGTPSGASGTSIRFSGNTTIAAVQNDVVTLSSHIKIVAGDTSNIDSARLHMYERDGSGGALVTRNGSDIASALSASIENFSETWTVSNASTAYVKPGFELTYTSGAIDITFRIYLPQLESGSLVTSLVRTSGTAVTRNGDNISVTAVQDWLYHQIKVKMPDYVMRVMGWDRVSYPITFTYANNVWTSDFDRNNYLADADVTTTYYVDIATGSDSDDGLSFANAKKSIHAAITAGNATGSPYMILVEAGEYPRHNSFTGAGGSVYPTQNCIIKAQNGRVSSGTWENLSWGDTAVDPSYPNCYRDNRTNITQIYDLTRTDANGDYIPLTRVSTAQECNDTPNTWYQGSGGSGTLYIRRNDDAAPSNANTRCELRISNFPVTGTINVYVEGVDFTGGQYGATNINSGAGVAMFKDCTFRYAGEAGTPYDGARMNLWEGLCVFEDCRATYNAKDGFNSHTYGTPAGGDTNYVLTINCASNNNGTDPASQSNNGITGHERCRWIDLNGVHNYARGRNVAFIGESRLLCLGTEARFDYGDGANSEASFRVYDTAKMWLIDCVGEAIDPATEYSILVSGSAEGYVYNFQNDGGLVSGSQDLYAQHLDFAIVVEFEPQENGGKNIFSLFLDSQNFITLRMSSSGHPQCQVTKDGVAQGEPFIATSVTKDAVNRVAIRITEDDMGISLNGSAVATDTSAEVPLELSELRFGKNQVGGESALNHYRSLYFYPVAVSDATLQALST